MCQGRSPRQPAGGRGSRRHRDGPRADVTGHRSRDAESSGRNRPARRVLSQSRRTAHPSWLSSVFVPVTVTAHVAPSPAARPRGMSGCAVLAIAERCCRGRRPAPGVTRSRTVPRRSAASARSGRAVAIDTRWRRGVCCSGSRVDWGEREKEGRGCGPRAEVGTPEER